MNKIKISIKGKIYDKDVANALSIKQTAFASMKRRNAIPYKVILDYCTANQIDSTGLLCSVRL